MQALIDLFSTDYGLLSVGVIAFVIGMAVFIPVWLNKQIDKERKSQPH
jgi:hypothetical protein